MTVSTTCSCGCTHLVNSDVKDLLNSTRKCFVCGEHVTFKTKAAEVAESPTQTSAVAAAPKRRGRPKKEDQPVKRRGRPRKQ